MHFSAFPIPFNSQLLPDHVLHDELLLMIPLPYNGHILSVHHMAAIFCIFAGGERVAGWSGQNLSVR